MQLGDVNQIYCPLQYVGLASAATYPFAVPLTLNTSRLSDAAVAAMNLAISKSLVEGNYTNDGADVFIPERRPTQARAERQDMSSPKPHTNKKYPRSVCES